MPSTLYILICLKPHGHGRIERFLVFIKLPVLTLLTLLPSFRARTLFEVCRIKEAWTAPGRWEFPTIQGQAVSAWTWLLGWGGREETWMGEEGPRVEASCPFGWETGTFHQGQWSSVFKQPVWGVSGSRWPSSHLDPADTLCGPLPLQGEEGLWRDWGPLGRHSSF